MLLLVIGFLAGVVTAISPCVLPVLPILLAGGASGGRRRPYAIIAGLVLSFTVFTLTAAWIILVVYVLMMASRERMHRLYASRVA